MTRPRCIDQWPLIFLDKKAALIDRSLNSSLNCYIHGSATDCRWNLQINGLIYELYTKLGIDLCTMIPPELVLWMQNKSANIVMKLTHWVWKSLNEDGNSVFTFKLILSKYFNDSRMLQKMTKKEKNIDFFSLVWFTKEVLWLSSLAQVSTSTFSTQWTPTISYRRPNTSRYQSGCDNWHFT